MKYILVFLLSFYKLIISPLIHAATGSTSACRYAVTCSEYARQSIETYGAWRGGLMAIKRILSCHPFAKVTPHQV